MYGRRCLKHEYPIQHKCYVDNYRRTHAWIDEGQSSSHLPEGAFTLEDPSVRDALKKIISENKDDLMDLKLGRTKKYAWREADVYKKIRKNLKYRRWKQRKVEKNANSDTGGPSEASEGPRSPSPSQLQEFSCPSEAEPFEQRQSESMPNRRESEPLEQRQFISEDMPNGDEEEEGDDETFVMRRLDVENVHEMYARLSTFMNAENAVARNASKRPPFLLNYRSLEEEDKLFLVATFYRHMVSDYLCFEFVDHTL